MSRPQMTIWRVSFACSIPKAHEDTHSEYVILVACHGNNCYANAPHLYVLRTLPILLNFEIGGACSFDCLQNDVKCLKGVRCVLERRTGTPKAAEFFWRSRWPSAKQQFISFDVKGEQGLQKQQNSSGGVDGRQLSNSLSHLT